MSSNGADVVLNQNITLLTQAIAALNTNMFQTAGGRPGILGGGGAAGGTRPGQGVNNIGDPHKDSVKLAASNQLLEKRLKETNDTIKYLIKNQNESMKNLNQYTATAGKYFENYLTKFSATQLNKDIPERLTKLFSSSIDQGLVEPLKDFESVLRLTKRMQTQNIEDALKYNEQLAKLGEAGEAGAAQFHVLSKKIEETGWDIDSLKTALNACSGDAGKLKEEFGKVAATLAVQAANDERATVATDKLTKAFKIFGNLVLTVGSIYLNAARSAAQFATTFTSPLKSAEMGMNPEDLAKVQHEQWQAIQSSNISMDEFNNKLVSGSWDLLQFTGSLAAGAKLTAGFLGTFRTLSNKTADQNGFLAQQKALFVDLNRTFSITGDQFAEMNAGLMQNSSVQASLYKLDKDRRVAYFQDLQLTQRRLLAYGLELEQVKRVTETLAEMNGKPAVTRIEQAAKIQAVGGALGMGRQASELAAILLRKASRPGDAKRQAELVAELQRGTANRYQGTVNRGAGGLGAEAALDELSQVAPEVFGTNTPTAALATSQGREINRAKQAQLANTNFLGGNIGDKTAAVVSGIMGLQDIMRTSAGDIVRAIWGAAAAYGAASLLSRGIGSVVGKAYGSSLGGASVGYGGVLRGVGGALGGAALGYGTTGSSGGAAGGALGGWGGAEAGALLGSAAGPIGTIIGGILGGIVGSGVGSLGGSKLSAWLSGGEQSGVGDIQQQSGQQEALIQQLQDQQNELRAKGDITDADKFGEHIKELKEEIQKLQDKLSENSPLVKEMKKMGYTSEQIKQLMAQQVDQTEKKQDVKIVPMRDTNRRY